MVDIKNHLDDIDHRVAEMEQSIELIATHVKRQLDGMRHAEQPAGMDGVADELKARMAHELAAVHQQLKEMQLKHTLETRRLQQHSERTNAAEGDAKIASEIKHLRHYVETTTQQLKSEIDHSVQERLAAADSYSGQDVRAQVAAVEQQMSTISLHVKEQMQALRHELREAQMRSLAELGRAGPAAGMEEKLQAEIERLQTFISDSQKTVGAQLEKRLNADLERLESFVADANKVLTDEVETKLRTEADRLEDLIYNSGKVLTERGMEQYLAKINKLKANLERYFNVKTQLLETRINEVSAVVKQLEEQRDLSAVEERIAALDAKLSADIAKLHQHHPARDVSHTELMHLKTALSALVPEAEVVGLEPALRSLREKMDVLDRADVHQLRAALEQRAAANEAEIASARARLEEHLQKLTLDFSHRINKLRHQIEADAASAKETLDNTVVHHLEAEVAEVREAVENSRAHALSLEKRFIELDAAVRSSSAVDQGESLREALEEETTNRLSNEKKLGDLERRITAMGDRPAGAAHASHLAKAPTDAAAIKAIERDMHLKAMDIITQQLHEFSKTLDRKIPELVTKDEFLQAIRETRAKMQGIESPDMTPLALRIEQLERDVHHISTVIDTLADRLPVIVE